MTASELVNFNNRVWANPTTNAQLQKLLGPANFEPDGLVVIRAEEAEGMLKPMSVRRIFGIGRSAEKSLLQFGI